MIRFSTLFLIVVCALAPLGGCITQTPRAPAPPQLTPVPSPVCHVNCAEIQALEAQMVQVNRDLATIRHAMAHLSCDASSDGKAHNQPAHGRPVDG